MKKLLSLTLSLTLFSSFAFAQSNSNADIDAALNAADQNICEQTADMKLRLQQSYAELGKLQLKLEQAEQDHPLAERAAELRKISGTSAVVFGALTAYAYNRGRVSNFKSPVMMTMNQYGLVISSAFAKISGIVFLAAQGTYMLTSKEINEFKDQIKKIKSEIEQFEAETQNCSQK